MRLPLFDRPCALHEETDGLPASEPVLTLRLGIAIDDAERDKVWFSVRDEAGGGERELALTLLAPHEVEARELGQGSWTLRIDTADAAAQGFARQGLTGFRMEAGARLASVTLVLRPALPDGTWSDRAPFLSVVACWTLTVGAAGAVAIGQDGAEVTGAANATAEVEACAGWACLVPPSPEPRIGDLLGRFDLESFAVGTGWFPFHLIDLGGLSPIHLNGFGRWFAELVGPPVALPPVSLPDWRLDLPAELDLPLGLRVLESELRLSGADGAYVVEARLEGLALDWNGAQVLEHRNFRTTVGYDVGSGRYVAELRLVEMHYPRRAEEVGRAFAFDLLPFGVLGLEATCWRLRLGLHAGGTAAALGGLCVDLRIEVGGLQVESALAGRKRNPLVQTDLRLHMRNFGLLVADPEGRLRPEGFLAGRFEPEVAGVFAPYAQAYAADADLQDRFSFAKRLVGAARPEEPANDHGLRFLDGDLRKGERVYVAWSQVGARFLDELSRDLFATPPAGILPDGAATTYLGLELAWFPGGERQIRLDWLDGGVGPQRRAPGEVAEWGEIDPGPPRRHALEFAGVGDRAIPLPPGSQGVATGPFPPEAQAIRFRLPGLQVEFARPRARSLVVRRQDGRDSVAYLFLYDAPEGAGDAAAPMARAEIGFALRDPETGAREVMNGARDAGGRPFLELGAGRAGTRPTALRALGWHEGEGLRFGDALSNDAAPPRILAIKAPPAAAWHDGCPVPAAPPQPVVPMRFGDFDTPGFGGRDWRYALRIGALDRVMDLFGGGSATDRPSLSVRRLIHEEGSRAVLIEAVLAMSLSRLGAGAKVEGAVTFRFDPADGSLSLEDGAALTLTQERAEPPAWAGALPLREPAEGLRRVWAKPLDLLGLKAHLFADLPTEPPVGAPLSLLTLRLDKGRLAIGLAGDADMVVRFEGFGEDALSFLVETFDLGPGGLNLTAGLIRSQLRVRGLRAPFSLEEARLEIVDDRLRTVTVEASGVLPKILDEAPVSLSVTLKQGAGGGIELDELVCRLGGRDQPILSRGTRFRFEIRNLELRYDGEGATRSFRFVVTGSAQFTPDPGEFQNGLLENLKSVRCEFVEAPLADDFAENVEIMVELNEPVTFRIYDLFRMEIRSIGFDPMFDGFAEPGPAVVIGGQCEFAAFGDVVSAEIDFHACRIGLPKMGEVLPQIHFDGLRVEISSPEGFRIAGMVRRYEGALIRGFAGEGIVGIPGFPELSAAFSFVRLRRDEGSPWRHAWFVAVEAAKMSIEIPPLPIYLRQVGLGFGYRYTLPLIKTFEDPEITTLAELVARMLRALDSHQTLASVESWTAEPEPEGGRVPWTVAMEAVFTIGTTQGGLFDYDGRREQGLKTLVAQVIAAIRSDFTLVAAAKIWFPVSVDDFFNDEDHMRSRPLASGFMLYSAPQRRFLAHAAKGEDPYLGKPDDPWPKEVQALVRDSHFEATLLIEPGLLHAELGWPDRLMQRLRIGGLEVEVRAGLLMRIENDAIMQGFYLSARGGMDLSGGVDLGFTGVRLTARVDVVFATRLMSALYLSRPLESKIYAELGLDLAVRFSVEAWLNLKAGFVSISFSVSFSFSVQVVVGLQIGWNGIGALGFKGRATVVVGVFGRSLRAGIAVGVNEGAVEGARAALRPYMASFLAPGEPPRVPDGNPLGGRGLARVARAEPDPRPAAFLAAGPGAAGEEPLHLAEGAGAAGEEPPQDDDFVLTRVRGRLDGKPATFVWIMPGPSHAVFYPLRRARLTVQEILPREETKKPPFETLGTLVTRTGVRVFNGKDWDPPKTTNRLVACQAAGAPVRKPGDPGTEPAGRLTLQQLLAACYLQDPEQAREWARDKRSFPEDYDADAILAPAKPTKLGQVLRDVRLLDEESGHRNPKRLLDPDDPFDAALIAAMADAEARRRSPAEAALEQALGSQSFLLQCFYDDLVTLADDGLAEILKKDTRPTLLDLGLVFVVEGEPDWVLRRRDKLATLTLDPAFRVPGRQGDFKLRPVVDFTEVDFARHPPVFNDAVAFHDEEVLALGWRLDWGGKAPERADDADGEAESYLKCYHVRVVDAGSNQTLLQRTISAADLLGAEGGEGRQRLRPRYQVTVPTGQLYGERAGPEQVARPLVVTVRPEDQSGGLGEAFSFTPVFAPTLRPLPPDRAECRLEVEGAGSGRPIPVARLTWEEPPLPDRPGVTGTTGWELVLRPLRQVPMGAYPEEAVEPEDRGLMSATGQALADGDLVVTLRTGGGALEARLAPDALAGATVTDGRVRVEEGHPSWAAWVSFRDRVPASRTEGRAWRLFLRALGRVPGPASGLTPVRLIAALSPEGGAAPAEGGREAPLRDRPLPHFEWPDLAPWDELPVTGPRALGGGLHVPTARRPTDRRTGAIGYLRAPGRERVISLDWPALDPRSAPAETYAATAEFAVHAIDLDRLANADLAEGGADGLDPDWRRVASVRPADRRVAGATPDTMADAQNWLSWPPAFAATRLWQQRDCSGIPDSEAASRWPGWYGWGEAFLEWPDPLDAVAERLGAAMGRATLSPSEIAALAYPPLGDAPRPRLRPKASRLAAWLALGQQAGGGLTHPWLALIVGWIAAQRMAQTTDGSLLPQAVHAVEASAGQPVRDRIPLDWFRSNSAAVDPVARNALGHLGLGLTISLRDPVTGFSRDQQDIDAQVRKAIAQVRRTAEELRASLEPLKARIDAAIEALPRAGAPSEVLGPLFDDMLDHVAVPAGAATELRLLAEGQLDRAATDLPIEALRRASEDCGDIAAAVGAFLEGEPALSWHLAFDAPIQASWARRAGPGEVPLADAALRMLHVSLRPLPRIATVPIAATVSSEMLAGEAVSALRIVWRNRNRAPERIARGGRLAGVLLVGDRIYALAEPDAEGKVAWPAGWGVDDPRSGIVPYDRPLPIDQDGTVEPDEPQASPFGAFAPDPKFWQGLWPTFDPAGRIERPDGGIEAHRQFARALGYVLRAFAPAADASGAAQTAEPLVTGLRDPAKAVPAFLDWSARFFATAPLAGRVGGAPAWLKEALLDTTISAPKSADRLNVAADADGRMNLTLPVEEEWATTRSYAILRTDRYARLRASMLPAAAPVPSLPAPEQRALMMKPGHRADLRLPRVRPIEPPQLLGQRVALLDDGAWNVLAVARHVEAWLHDAALPLRRKIEFGATTRAYWREPHEAIRHWAGKLQSSGWISGPVAAPVGGAAADGPWIDDAPPDGLEPVRMTQLAQVPKLRLGGDVYATPADPFWYQTTVALGAYAGTARSREKETALSVAPPFETWALGPDPVEVEVGREADWAELPEVGTAVRERLARWRGLFPPEAAPWMTPDLRRLRVRLPRLIESLPPGSTESGGTYPDEAVAGTLGTLPDPGLSLHVTQEGLGTEASLLRLTPVPDPGSTTLYAVAMLDDGLAPVEVRAPDGARWSDGLRLVLPLRRPFARVASDLAPPSEATMAPTEEPGRAFPVIGSMAQLLPLALQLHSVEAAEGRELVLADPPFGPAWLGLPHLAPDDPVAMTREILAQGCAMVLDRHRRHAGGWLCADMAAPAPEGALDRAGLRGVLGRVPAARLAHLGRRVASLRVADLGPAEALAGVGVALWFRREGEDGPAWIAYEAGVGDQEELRVLAVAERRADEAGQRAELARIWPAIAPVSEAGAVLDDAAEAARAAEALAASGFHGAPLTGLGVRVQRGNEPRRPWTTRPRPPAVATAQQEDAPWP